MRSQSRFGTHHSSCRRLRVRLRTGCNRPVRSSVSPAVRYLCFTVGGTGIDGDRLALAKKLGADDVVDITAEDAVVHAPKVYQWQDVRCGLRVFRLSQSYRHLYRRLKKTGHYQQVGLFGKPCTCGPGSDSLQGDRYFQQLRFERTTWLRVLPIIEKGLLNIEPLCSYVMDLEDWKKPCARQSIRKGYKVLFQLKPRGMIYKSF